jgi:hypothetical protein
VIDKSFFTNQKNGAETFYEYYSKEPHRKFRKSPKERYMGAIEYIIQNTRSTWDSDKDVPFWSVKTNIKVYFS